MSHQIKNLMEMIDMPKEGILSISVEDNEHYKVVMFMMQVLKGSADFTLGEVDYEVKPGDHFYMPPNFNHAIKAKEDFVFLLNLNR